MFYHNFFIKKSSLPATYKLRLVITEEISGMEKYITPVLVSILFTNYL